jgi:hypothetical protein
MILQYINKKVLPTTGVGLGLFKITAYLQLLIPQVNSAFNNRFKVRHVKCPAYLALHKQVFCRVAFNWYIFLGKFY